MSEGSNEATENRRPQASLQGPRLSLRTVFILLTSLLITFGLARIFFGDPTPVLTAETLAAAEARWKAAQWKNYDLRFELDKGKRDVYELQVRHVEAQQMLLNGRAVEALRARDAWTVPGMFNTIADDLAHVQAHAKGTASPATPRLRLWCEFDATTGIPLRYRRLDSTSGQEVEWEVHHFAHTSP